MTFDTDKKRYMESLHAEEYSDRSKKGSVDVEIKPLLDVINAHDDYYTTSSCAGRIVLFAQPESGKKHEAEWLFVSHALIEYEQLVPAIAKIPQFEQTIFFRQESAILHVCCRTMDAAQQLVDHAKNCGFKRSGIMHTRNRIMLELMSTEKIDAPIAQEGELLVNEKYLKTIVAIGNERLGMTRKKIQKLLLVLE